MKNHLVSISPLLSFADVILIPQTSDIQSRLDVDLTSDLTRNIKIKSPIMATNMSTITEAQMMIEMHHYGATAALHRFMSIGQITSIVDRVAPVVENCIVSIGAKEEDKQWVEELAHLAVPPKVLLVDIAHGDSQIVCNMIQHIKSNYPQFDVIGGNVATAAGYKHLVDAGADAVRVGIGGGSHCTTRQVTGHGVPTLASIMMCAEIASLMPNKVPIIADGGFKTSGDIVKALAFGADCVCLGNMLAATSATPGAIINLPDGQFKEMYGMSSRVAQERHKGGLKRGIAEEGMESLVPYKGETGYVVEQILGGIRSGLTYSGAKNISELRENFLYGILSNGSMKESKY